MDLRQLLGKLDIIEGTMKGAERHSTGPEFTGYWKGKDAGTPGKHMVGGSAEYDESILKDLSKGKTPKTKAEELAEEYQAFLEAEFKDTVDKRPGRKSDRHPRGHEPQPRYKTVKADEGVGQSHYKWEITFKNGEKAAYHHDSPHYSDATAASDIEYTKKSNPGSTVIATKDGKPFDWESLLGEGWESGPEEYEEPYDDADDAYERQRQAKIDTEAEREWAKLPKTTTYKLYGRGPNMEPNYEFGDELDSMEKAIEYRKELMADPKTPHPEHIGIHTITRVKDQTDEAVEGGGHLRNYEHYIEKLDNIHAALQDPKQQANWPWYRQALGDLNRIAKAQGFPVKESRGHKTIATKLKNIELAKKFASGELKIPTPQERQAQLEKSKKKVNEYGATSTGSTTSTTQSGASNSASIPPVLPDEMKKAVAATTALKSATGSTAPAPNLMKAIDAASQGKQVSGQDMKALEPMMKDVATISKEPKLVSQLKSVLSQAQQIQQKP